METVNAAPDLSIEKKTVEKARVMEVLGTPIRPMMVIIHVVTALAMEMRNALTLLVMANMAPRCIATVIKAVVLGRVTVNTLMPGLVIVIAGRTTALVTATRETKIVAPNQVRVKILHDAVLTAHNIHRWLIAVPLADLITPIFGMISVVVIAHRITAADRC